MVEKMSIHRALAELKNYNKRINKAISQDFIKANKKSNRKIKGIDIEDYKKIIQSNFDSICALIENKKKIKSAIVLSNASTIVEIGNEKYTVAEAIERKNQIEVEKLFLANLKSQYVEAVAMVEKKNSLLPEAVENYLTAILGDKDKRTVEDIELHTKSFYAREEYELIDPMKIKEYIDDLEYNIDIFETNVDYILSESNATTFIEVDLCS